MSAATSARAAAATWRAAWREAVANRAGFWTQIAVMAVNDGVWVVFWMLFFNRVGSIGEWDVDRVIILFAVLTTAVGVVLGLFNNARRIGHLAATGELDAALTLPVPPLVHLLCRRVEAVFVGDLFFGVLLFIVFGQPTPQRALVFGFGVACAITILTGFLIAVGSIGFWLGRSDAGDLGFHSIVLFSNYPVDVFSGFARFMLYGVVPAGFVSSVPARLVDEFDLVWALATAGVACLVATIGWIVFHRGLRRYSSGSSWTLA